MPKSTNDEVIDVSRSSRMQAMVCWFVEALRAVRQETLRPNISSFSNYLECFFSVHSGEFFPTDALVQGLTLMSANNCVAKLSKPGVLDPLTGFIAPNALARRGRRDRFPKMPKSPKDRNTLRKLFGPTERS